MIKLKDILFESEDKLLHVIKPRKSREEREKNYQVVLSKRISNYIKNGLEGNLNLSSSPITQLPDEIIKVGGTLNLIDTPIRYLPENLKLIKDDLLLQDSYIKSLPDDLIIGGNLEIWGTRIEKLPKNLSIGGDLYIGYSYLEEIPTDIKIGGDAHLQGNPIRDIPQTAIINGNVYIENTPFARELASHINDELFDDENIEEVQKYLKHLYPNIKGNFRGIFS